MDIQVTVTKIGDMQVITSKRTGNITKKYLFVGTTGGQYPKTIAFAVLGEERYDKMQIEVGATYQVAFDIESREWNGKYYTELSAWQAVRMDARGGIPNAQPANTTTTASPQNAAPSTATQATQAQEEGGLPF